MECISLLFDLLVKCSKKEDLLSYFSRQVVESLKYLESLSVRAHGKDTTTHIGIKYFWLVGSKPNGLVDVAVVHNISDARGSR